MSSELLANLNPRQLEAVTAPEQSVLILAGAGSGKTRVLTTRIAWLLEQHLATTSEILAVTFTNKAAREMTTRLEAMLPYDLRRMWIGTFHGLCNRILRRHAEYAGLPKGFQILDGSDQLSLVKRIMKSANVDPEKTDAKQVASFINWMKEQGLRSTVLTEKDGPGEHISLYRLYERECQVQGVVDFAELLLRCQELLESNELIRAHYQQRFRHILVDEFQDTNILQYRWLKLLAGAGIGEGGSSLNAVFAVGDDDQSIYAFRGARVGNMSDFIRDFEVKSPIRLEQNYRSTKVILDAANALIEKNSLRLGKNLWTAGAAGDRIVVKELASDGDEAKWVVDQMQFERRRGASGWRDFAVLYRTNAQSRSIESELSARGIPYRVYGGLRFFERAEVKNVLGYLRVITNPWDDTSFLRVVNTPARGIGAKTIETLSAQAREKGVSLWAALTDPAAKITPKLAAFAHMITSMRLEAEKLPLLEAISFVIKASGLEEAYSTERDGEDRIANMREILSAARGWLEAQGASEDLTAFAPLSDEAASPMEGFLTQATLEAGDKNEEAGADAVQLMTVHSAKGLEFPWVWIIGAEEGLFPHFSAVKENDSGKSTGLEEERRLMYVAITRAKTHLCFTHCASRMMWGNTFRNPLSSFVEEIPDGLLDQRPLMDKDDEASGFGTRRSSWGGSSSWGGARRQGERSESRYGRSSGHGSARGSSSGCGVGSPAKSSSFSGGLSSSSASNQQRAAERETGFRAGERIRHDVFGEGVVEGHVGAGSACVIKVKFGRESKALLFKIAKEKLHHLG